MNTGDDWHAMLRSQIGPTLSGRGWGASPSSAPVGPSPLTRSSIPGRLLVGLTLLLPSGRLGVRWPRLGIGFRGARRRCMLGDGQHWCDEHSTTSGAGHLKVVGSVKGQYPHRINVIRDVGQGVTSRPWCKASISIEGFHVVGGPDRQSWALVGNRQCRAVR